MINTAQKKHFRGLLSENRDQTLISKININSWAKTKIIVCEKALL